MKLPVLIFFVVSISIFQSAHAQLLPEGPVEPVSHQKFIEAVNALEQKRNFPYEAAGMRWSKNQGYFTNGCVNSRDGYDRSQCNTEGADDQGNPLVQVQDKGDKLGSKAAQKCASLGGHLPTKSEYEKLIRSFKPNTEYTEEEYGPRLTQAGRASLAKVFGESIDDLQSEFLWSSSVNPNGSDYAYVFYGDYGDVGYGNRVYSGVAVRCVAGR